MRSRLELHNELAVILGNPNLYYQQPENYKLKYPCVIYNQEAGDIKKASNRVYSYTRKYTVTFIYTIDNETIIQDMLTAFEYCNLDRVFVSDNLYHYTFTLYY